MGDMNNYKNEQTRCEQIRKGRSSREGLCLNMVVPAGKRKHMCRILKPIVRDVRGLACLLDVTERSSLDTKQEEGLRPTAPNYTVSSHELSTPALAVMLIVPEHSQTTPDATTVQRKFLEFPWRYHHAIQLQNVAATPSVLGQQEFYFLSRQLPLWSVSAGLQQTGLKVRFNIFVRRFSAMVEFYRLITSSEMESKKAGFCVFPLTTGHLGDFDSSNTGEEDQPLISCELALKQCSMVNPFPLSDAYLSFPVSNLKSLLRILPTQARSVSNHRYLIHDPDGNPLILFNTDYHKDIGVIPGVDIPLPANMESNNTRVVTDKSSDHEFSVDSGRFSDFETSSFELENCMSKLIEEVGLLKTDSGRGSYDSGMLSHDCDKQKTARVEQTFRSGHQENSVHPLVSRLKSDGNDKSNSHDKCTQDLMYRVVSTECNSINSGAYVNQTNQCRGRIEPSPLCQCPHTCVSDHDCKFQTCAKNVFLSNTLLISRTCFSETEL